MKWWTWHLPGFAIALALALYFTPVLREAARRYGIVDAPDGRLKTHAAPVAYLGGLALFLAFLVALGLTLPFEQDVLGILLGASIVLLLGLVDDLRALSPAVKLLGQLLAAFMLIKAGIRIEIAFLPGWLAILLTVVWVVGVTNAFNIIDVADGLAASVACVALAFLGVIALLSGDSELAQLTLCLAGAGAGFLRYNFRPASIYLGDAGSMLLGFVIGAVAMKLAYADQNPLAVWSPVLVLGVPLFDTAFVMIERLRRGAPLFKGSPDHFAVRLRRAGASDSSICLGAALVSAALGAAALGLVFASRPVSIALLAGTGAAAVIAGLVFDRVGAPPSERASP